jgi:hypothetical protein
MITITGTKSEIEEFKKNNAVDLSSTEVKIIEMGSITDEEISKFGRFNEYERKIIKEQYASYPKDFFPNPICALH